jgi:hypothetical protein
MKLVRFDKPSRAPDESAWTELVTRIRALALSTKGSAIGTVHRWVVDVGVIVALRLGITEAVANHFEQDEKLIGFWQADAEITNLRNKAPTQRGWHAHVAKYFPEAWPSPISSEGK